MLVLYLLNVYIDSDWFYVISTHLGAIKHMHSNGHASALDPGYMIVCNFITGVIIQRNASLLP